MAEQTVQRTLVKSPPELWAEVSDAASLARHLDQLAGEIHITRSEPETTVAWEGERARGTVEIEPSGWGTKVTLTATPVAPEPEPVEPDPEPEPEPEQEPAPAAVAAEPAPAPAAVAPEPAPAPAEPAPQPVSANDLLARTGFFARMFRRHAEVADRPDPPLVPVPEPEPEPVPEPEPEPLPEPTPLPERPDPEPPPAAEADDGTAEELAGLLNDALDSLGAAHHRPFSR